MPTRQLTTADKPAWAQNPDEEVQPTMTPGPVTAPVLPDAVGAIMEAERQARIKRVADFWSHPLPQPQKHKRHGRTTVLATPTDWRSAFARLQNLVRDLNDAVHTGGVVTQSAGNCFGRTSSDVAGDVIVLAMDLASLVDATFPMDTSK
jgi:hypothetical protein